MLSGRPQSVRYLLLDQAIGSRGNQAGFREGGAFGRDHVQQLLGKGIVEDNVRPRSCSCVFGAQGAGSRKEAAQRVKLEINMQFRRLRLQRLESGPPSPPAN
ncbi:hypothetical protein BwSH20_52310 [Bradyrhizobium ottawaense]|nr:hypothetical protein SG09_47840 [Bradyrhizobium ottawaense]BBO13421.1 hypothetical protein TM102_48910 [Bradyrhizobium sp. TM102]GMO16786.1 hypothetical protein BwSH14_07020 [Bradyrhizobium ottawaense]GMO39773.1 hypothetical protein BwSF12_41250 [Bradyrhizobium ottawaense]GMO41003.1 hypothetical protein BwSF21_52340 [Bradyrhizobium ottawaense]